MSQCLYFPLLWVDLVKDLTDSQAGRLLKNLVAYREGSVFDDLFSDDSVLCSVWRKMRSMFDEDSSRRAELSRKRKLAGSKGGLSRARKYRKPDGHNKPVYNASSSDPDDGQIPLHSEEVLEDSKKARIAGVRVLPVVPEKTAAASLPAVSVLPVCSSVSDGNGLLKAVGSFVGSPAGVPVNEQPVVVPVYLAGSSMGNLFAEYVPAGNSSVLSPASTLGSGQKPARKRPSHNPVLFEDDPLPEPVKVVKRHRYGYYKKVLLTDSQFDTLKREFPDDYEKWIERADQYCEESGRTYTNFLAVIRNWARKDAKRALSGGPGFSRNYGRKRSRYVDRIEDAPLYDPASREVTDQMFDAIRAEEERAERMFQECKKGASGQ